MPIFLVKLKDILDFSVGPISSNFRRVLQKNPLEIEDFSCCFSLKTHEKTLDIRVLDENQARIWIIGLKRVLSSQRILQIPQDFYINQPFSFQKFLNNLRQKAWEAGISIANLIRKTLENTNYNIKKEVFPSVYRYNQRNSVNNYKYLSMGGKKETLKSIESYINPLNDENFKEKPEIIPLRRSQTERNFMNKAHNSNQKNSKTRQIHNINEIEEKENQDSYNYQANTSINCFRKQQKTKIKLSFDKTSLKQKVWALMKENQENKSFITNPNESFAGNSMKRNSKEINRNSIENLTIEIADLDLISPKKQENMNLTGNAVFQEGFDNLNVIK